MRKSASFCAAPRRAVPTGPEQLKKGENSCRLTSSKFSCCDIRAFSCRAVPRESKLSLSSFPMIFLLHISRTQRERLSRAFARSGVSSPRSGFYRGCAASIDLVIPRSEKYFSVSPVQRGTEPPTDRASTHAGRTRSLARAARRTPRSEDSADELPWFRVTNQDFSRIQIARIYLRKIRDLLAELF